MGDAIVPVEHDVGVRGRASQSFDSVWLTPPPSMTRRVLRTSSRRAPALAPARCSSDSSSVRTRPLEREGVESRELLPVQLEPAFSARHGADARDVAVVELDELELLSGPPRRVVVGLEERLRPGEAVPHHGSDERAELTFGVGTDPDDPIPLVEHDERQLLRHRDGHGADILGREPEGVEGRDRSVGAEARRRSAGTLPP